MIFSALQILAELVLLICVGNLLKCGSIHSSSIAGGGGGATYGRCLNARCKWPLLLADRVILRGESKVASALLAQHGMASMLQGFGAI